MCCDRRITAVFFWGGMPEICSWKNQDSNLTGKDGAPGDSKRLVISVEVGRRRVKAAAAVLVTRSSNLSKIWADDFAIPA